MGEVVHPFSDEEWAEIVEEPRMIHLYDARQVVALLANERRLRAQLEVAEKELAVAKRIVTRYLPELLEAFATELAALSNEGGGDG
jgi:hypothetical protein